MIRILILTILLLSHAIYSSTYLNLLFLVFLEMHIVVHDSVLLLSAVYYQYHTTHVLDYPGCLEIVGNHPIMILTRFNEIAVQATTLPAADKEAVDLSWVHM